VLIGWKGSRKEGQKESASAYETNSQYINTVGLVAERGKEPSFSFQFDKRERDGKGKG